MAKDTTLNINFNVKQIETIFDKLFSKIRATIEFNYDKKKEILRLERASQKIILNYKNDLIRGVNPNKNDPDLKDRG